MNLQVINQKTLKQLVDDGIITSATAVSHESQWELIVSYGKVHKVLATTPSNKIRTWAKMDTLIEYVAKLGIKNLEADLSSYSSKRSLSRKRPDRAEAMRKTHEAAKHDEWFRKEVIDGLALAESRDAVWTSSDEVRANMEHRKQRLMEQANG
jgi:hypothetical protein